MTESSSQPHTPTDDDVKKGLTVVENDTPIVLGALDGAMVMRFNGEIEMYLLHPSRAPSNLPALMLAVAVTVFDTGNRDLLDKLRYRFFKRAEELGREVTKQ